MSSMVESQWMGKRFVFLISYILDVRRCVCSKHTFPRRLVDGTFDGKFRAYVPHVVVGRCRRDDPGNQTGSIDVMSLSRTTKPVMNRMVVVEWDDHHISW